MRSSGLIDIRTNYILQCKMLAEWFDGLRDAQQDNEMSA